MITLVLKLASPEIKLYVRSSKSNSVLIWSEKNLTKEQIPKNNQGNKLRHFNNDVKVFAKMWFNPSTKTLTIQKPETHYGLQRMHIIIRCTSIWINNLHMSNLDNLKNSLIIFMINF